MISRISRQNRKLVVPKSIGIRDVKDQKTLSKYVANLNKAVTQRENN